MERPAAMADEEEEEKEEEEEEEEGRVGRAVCGEGCGRPKRVCICAHLPESPIRTATAVLVLQHPHERRRRLATTPLLRRCLLNCAIIPGRRLLPAAHPLPDSLLRPNPPAALFLFPSPAGPPDPDPPAQAHPGASRVLIVFDGTWTQAREMVRASAPFLTAANARRVSLGGGVDLGSDGPSMFESELALRKEPHRGCLSTAEAVARALAALEPSPGQGPRAEAALLPAVRAMVRGQLQHFAGKPPPPFRRNV
ncbi:DTW domain-containing protein [Wolffia australiana]